MKQGGADGGRWDDDLPRGVQVAAWLRGRGHAVPGERQPLYAEEGKFQPFEVGGGEAALLVAQGDERQQAAVVSKEQAQDAE